MSDRIIWKGEPAWFVIKPNGLPVGVKYSRAPSVYANTEEAESAELTRHKIVRGVLVLREVE